MIQIAIDCWAEVAEHAKAAGLKYVFWEPMSVAREFGETIAACMALQDRLTTANMAVPMWMMADIDHGDITSPDPDDTNPYAWARAVPGTEPHHPYQAVDDEQVRPPPLHRRLQRQGVDPARTTAESLRRGRCQGQRDLPQTSFKEREPNDRQSLRRSPKAWLSGRRTSTAACRT